MKKQRFETILRRLTLQSGVIQEEVYRTPYHDFRRLDALNDILLNIDKQIEATTLKLAQLVPDTSKPMDWNKMERDLVKHKYHLHDEHWRQNRPTVRPTQFARQRDGAKPATKTKQQLKKEVARAKWLANQQKQERLAKARAKQQAFRTNFYRQQAIPKPQRKTFNVYQKHQIPCGHDDCSTCYNQRTGKRKYKKGMKCHGCGEDIDDCEC